MFEFNKYLNGNFCEWNDLGDPYDRVLFPGAPEIGKTEFHFVREFPELTKKLISQVTSHEETIIYLKTRFEIFFDMVQESTSSTGPIFLLGILALPEFIFSFFPFLKNWSRKNFEIYGPLTTAYVIKALFGCNYNKNEILNRKPLPEGILPKIDGKFTLHENLHQTDPKLFLTLQKVACYSLDVYNLQ